MSKFEINRINRKLIRAILKLCMYENNFQIIFLYIEGGGKEKQNLRIALINFLKLHQ